MSDHHPSTSASASASAAAAAAAAAALAGGSGGAAIDASAGIWFASKNEEIIEKFTGPLVIDQQPEGDDFFAYYLCHVRALGVMPHPALLAAQRAHQKRAETIAAAAAAAATAAATAAAAAANAGGDEYDDGATDAKRAGAGKKSAPISPPNAGGAKERRTTGGTGGGKQKAKSGGGPDGFDGSEVDTDLVRVLSLRNTVIDSGTLLAICLTLPLCKSLHTLKFSNCGLTFTHIRELAHVLPKTGVTNLAIDENPLTPFSSLPAHILAANAAAAAAAAATAGGTTGTDSARGMTPLTTSNGTRPGTSGSVMSITGGSGGAFGTAVSSAIAPFTVTASNGPHPFSSSGVISSFNRLLHSRGGDVGVAGAAGKAGVTRPIGAGAGTGTGTGTATPVTTKPASKEVEKSPAAGEEYKAPGSAGSIGSSMSGGSGGGRIGGAPAVAASTAPAVPVVINNGETLIASDEVFAELLESSQQMNSQLQVLSLRANRLSYFAVAALCTALKKNHTLLSLNLSYNTLGDVLGTHDPLSSAVTHSLMPLPPLLPPVCYAPYLSTLFWGAPPAPAPAASAADPHHSAHASKSSIHSAVSTVGAAGAAAAAAGKKPVSRKAAAAAGTTPGAAATGDATAARANRQSGKKDDLTGTGPKGASKPATASSPTHGAGTGSGGGESKSPRALTSAGSALSGMDVSAGATVAVSNLVFPHPSAVSCIGVLVDSLLVNKTIVQINLSNNKISDEGFRLLSTVFFPVPLDKEEIKRLKRDGGANSINATKAIPVRDTNHSVRAIDLSANRITDSSIAHALRMGGEDDDAISAFIAAPPPPSQPAASAAGTDSAVIPTDGGDTKAAAPTGAAKSVIAAGSKRHTGPMGAAASHPDDTKRQPNGAVAQPAANVSAAAAAANAAANKKQKKGSKPALSHIVLRHNAGLSTTMKSKLIARPATNSGCEIAV